MGEIRKKIRLMDLAREAKVSAATVSRYVGGKAEVNPETRERIAQAASRLGFNLAIGRNPRVMAFALANRSVLYPFHSSAGVLHPFHSAVLSGAESHCTEHGYGLLFMSIQYSLNATSTEIELPEIVQNKNVVSGIILAGTNSKELLDLLTQRRIPWVTLGNNVLGDLEKDRKGLIYVDDFGGGYDLTRYLQSLGHQHIAFVGNRKLPWYARRYEGYQRAMTEAYLPVRYSELSVREGECLSYLTTKLMLQETPAPTAIFVGDDTLCVGVYRAVRDFGLTIPRDLSVVGFNDTPEARFLQPQLTSANVFAEELGRQLSELLIRRIEGSELGERMIIIPTQLVRRESCTPLVPTPIQASPRESLS
jgi:LacI family transcriptional regulator